MSSLRWCTFLQLQHYNEKWMFSILHLNAPTLLKKSWPTKSSSQKSQRSFSVLGASETWLTNFTSKLVNITRYNFVSNHRKSKAKFAFIHKTILNIKFLMECKFTDPEVIESIFVEIIAFQGKNVIAVCVYRPPKSKHCPVFRELEWHSQNYH